MRRYKLFIRPRRTTASLKTSPQGGLSPQQLLISSSEAGWLDRSNGQPRGQLSINGVGTAGNCHGGFNSFRTHGQPCNLLVPSSSSWISSIGLEAPPSLWPPDCTETTKPEGGWLLKAWQNMRNTNSNTSFSARTSSLPIQSQYKEQGHSHVLPHQGPTPNSISCSATRPGSRIHPRQQKHI